MKKDMRRKILMKKDMKEFGVADSKVTWEASQRAPLRVTPFTRYNTGPSYSSLIQYGRRERVLVFDKVFK